VDLQPLFFNLTLDISTEFLLGKSTNLLAPGDTNKANADFADAFNRGVKSLGGAQGLLSHFLPSRQFRRDCRLIHAYVDAIVDKALSENDDTAPTQKPDRYVLLDELLEQTHDRIQIRSELLNILLAGRDTTASLLSNVWFELSRRPDIWTRLRTEVDALQGETPSFEQLRDMKYLRAVLNESLRLYPIVPGNSREALADTVLPLGGGEDGKSPLFVPKGKAVTWSVWSMHRRRDAFGEDAADFKPERWLDTDEKKGIRPGWAFLPFNGGPRICIGQQFALTETEYTMVRLMQEFRRLESRDPEPWRELLMLTCTGLGGCKVGLFP